MFISSIQVVNVLRMSKFHDVAIEDVLSDSGLKSRLPQKTGSLIFMRWVGIEGALTLSMYPHKDFSLLKEALKEKMVRVGTSFYDKRIATSGYMNLSLKHHHFITLPGIIGFLFYSGSYIFLFVSILVIAWIFFYVETLTRCFSGGNIYLCSLIAQVLAYRLAHFGYVPAQSYKLIGSIFITVFAIYFLELFLRFFGFNQSANSQY